MNIGDRIKAARKAAGLSQEELARRARMSLKGMGDIERGDIADPHYSSLNKIARGLGIPVGELLEETVPLDEAPEEGTGPATKQDSPSSPSSKAPPGIDEEQWRLLAYVRPWLLLLDNYSERWERAAKERSFSIDAFMEFSATTDDILKSVNWVQDNLQRVQGIDPMSGSVGFVFRETLLRLTRTMGLVSEAAMSILGSNELSEVKKKRLEIDSAREELVKRIAT